MNNLCKDCIHFFEADKKAYCRNEPLENYDLVYGKSISYATCKAARAFSTIKFISKQYCGPEGHNFNPLFP